MYGFAVVTEKSYISEDISNRIVSATSRIVGIASSVTRVNPLITTCREQDVLGPNIDQSLPFCRGI